VGEDLGGAHSAAPVFATHAIIFASWSATFVAAAWPRFVVHVGSATARSASASASNFARSGASSAASRARADPP